MLGLPDNAHLLLLNRSLDEAIKGNRLRDVQRLVAEGADLDSTDSSVYGRTPLHWACCQNADPSIAIFLLERGADPNALDEYGESPLFYACRYGHADLVRALIECGADVNLSNKHNQQARHLARSHSHLHIVRILMEQRILSKEEKAMEYMLLDSRRSALATESEALAQHQARKEKRTAIIADLRKKAGIEDPKTDASPGTPAPSSDDRAPSALLDDDESACSVM
eukprot:gnl/Spiro4/13272_TR7049_c0_g1_i1.p1 gnl/Spiro4/13272_TR7049_c0_g1~~gnl/Spiro4/13272_TR7049_c0_g1_i1.p1  ORF type:complete len:225 (+),score=39.47 gnl/Spiro4/13272_TR7049_c0_g1_i1:241-915(+)